MPKTHDRSGTTTKATNAKGQMGNMEEAVALTKAGAKTDLNAIIEAIAELKSEVKGDNVRLGQEINQMREELNGKLDNMTKEMQSLAGRVEEAEIRVQQVEDWAFHANEALCKYMEQQKVLQQKFTDLESRSQRNNICIFGVPEGVKGDSLVIPEIIPPTRAAATPGHGAKHPAGTPLTRLQTTTRRDTKTDFSTLARIHYERNC
uniref:Uncharacterized protein n=2 Tax=Nothobranchius furzeri TaxID=105023 RepID=A0A1A7ZKV3_NOTFU